MAYRGDDDNDGIPDRVDTKPKVRNPKPGGDEGCSGGDCTTKPWTPDPKCDGSLAAAESCG